MCMIEPVISGACKRVHPSSVDSVGGQKVMFPRWGSHTRLMLRCPRLTHVSDMLQNLKLQSLYYRRDLHISLFMYKVLNGYILDEQIIRLFVYLEDARPHNTRATASHDVVVNKCRTMFGR